MVGCGEHPGVVVDHDDGVPILDELADDVQDPVDVGGVQADGGFVQDVEDAGRAVADSAGQLHALALAVGQCGGGAVEREVGQAQVGQALHGLGHLVDDDAGHGRDLVGDEAGHARRPLAQSAQGQARGLAQVDAVDEGRAHPLPQARAVAGGARARDEVLADAGEGLLVLGLGERVLHGGDRVEVGEVQFRAARLGGDHDVPFLGGPLVDDSPLLLAEVAEGHVRAHPHLACDVLHELPHEGAPRRDCPLVDGERLVGHQGGAVDDALDPGALAHGAGPGGVEGHLLGAQSVEGLTALGAHERHFQGNVARGRHTVPAGAQVGAGAREQQAQVVEQLRGRAEGGAHVGHTRPLAQGEGGGDVGDPVDRRPGGLGDAPARVGRQGLQVAAGSFRVEGAQGQGGLARPGHSRDGDESVQGDVDVEVLEVVDARSAHLDAGGGRAVGHVLPFGSTRRGPVRLVPQ